MAYIYQITNDVNGKIYIGKTEFSIEKRFKEHCQDSKKETEEHRPLYSAMRKYGIEHFHIELLEETDNPEERERYWIEKLGSFKWGYNATIGGDGRRYLDYDLIIATYQKLQNCCEVARVLKIHPDSVRKILKSKNITIFSSQDINAIKNAKPVFMYNKDGKMMKAFDSTAEAARFLIEHKLTNCKFTTIRYHISEVCKNKRKSAAGYTWSY